MKKIITILIMLGFTSPTFSQQPKSAWAVQSTGGNTNVSSGVATDTAGNTYITGNFNGAITFGSTTLTSKGGNDIFIAKINPTGEYLWAVRAGGVGQDRANSIATDAVGNVYVTGSFTLMSYFGTDTLTASNKSNIFISKLNTNGDFVWTNQAGGSMDDAGYGITVDANGSVYVTGFFQLVADFGNLSLNVQDNTMGGVNQQENLFVTKLNASGTFIWVTQGGGDGKDFGYDIDVNTAGEVFVAGYILDDAWFAEDGSVFVSNQSGYYSSFIAKFHNNGTCQWAKGIVCDNINYGYAVTTDNNGNSYLLGKYSGKAVLSNLEETAQGNFDLYLIKYNTSGNVDWYKLYGYQGEVQGHVVAIDKDENLYLGGTFNNSVIFGTDTITTNGGFDFFIVKMNQSGKEEWIYSGGSILDETLSGIKVSTDSSVYITGVFNADMDLDSQLLTTSSLQSIYVSKLSFKTNDDGNYNTGLSNILFSDLIQVYPNPAKQYIKIINMPIGTDIYITDLQGREIMRSKTASTELSFSTEDIENGVYFIRAGHNRAIKLIINKD
ncbi:MAG: SBBP repeat-containing protein [Bacteroidia bacterium]|nr:SBBP repeat-containing protein [Bacteroidia bacterium]MCO5254859.1 SBBP repeat-containing protein [Bacteroidota bacterium]